MSIIIKFTNRATMLTNSILILYPEQNIFIKKIKIRMVSKMVTQIY